jgi:hypothetical protein
VGDDVFELSFELSLNGLGRFSPHFVVIYNFIRMIPVAQV